MFCQGWSSFTSSLCYFNWKSHVSEVVRNFVLHSCIVETDKRSISMVLLYSMQSIIGKIPVNWMVPLQQLISLSGIIGFSLILGQMTRYFLRYIPMSVYGRRWGPDKTRSLLPTPIKIQLVTAYEENSPPFLCLFPLSFFFVGKMKWAPRVKNKM